jgi:hypothetical protein
LEIAPSSENLARTAGSEKGCGAVTHTERGETRLAGKRRINFEQSAFRYETMTPPTPRIGTRRVFFACAIFHTTVSELYERLTHESGADCPTRR